MEKLQPLFASALQYLLDNSHSPFTGRQGCSNNPLEVFSFLAFGLYLLNLAMGMQRRRKRSVSSDVKDNYCQANVESEQNPDLEEAAIAFNSMFWGFIDVLVDTEDEICNQFSICEAAKKASEMGEVGRIIAKAAGENIANRFNDDSLRVAMDLGIDDQNCKQKFECKKKF